MVHLPRYEEYYQINEHTGLTPPQQLRVRRLTTKPKETKVTMLKRKVGYVDEELSVTKTKMSHMEIDTQQERKLASLSKAMLQNIKPKCMSIIKRFVT